MSGNGRVAHRWHASDERPGSRTARPVRRGRRNQAQNGTALADDARPEEIIELAAFGDEERRVVSRREVAEILQARTEEIFSMVLTEIKRSGYDGLLPAGVVLCGGCAQLTGIKTFAREIVGLPIRVGAPQRMDGLVERVSAPAFATSVGLTHWGVRQADRQTVELSQVAARASCQ